MSDHHCQSSVSEEDLAALQAKMLERCERECGGMPLDIAHGFLTAMVSGPRLVLPNEWLPRIIGESGLNEDNAEWLLNATMGLYQDIVHDLDHGHYGPLILYKPLESADPLPLPYGWCQGYVQGMYMHGEGTVEESGSDAEAAGYLAPIAAFLMYEQDQYLDPPDSQVHRETAEQLAGAALGLYHWWLPRRDAPGQPS